MSGVKLHIDIDDRRINEVLSRLIATGQDLEPVMEDIATYGESSTRDRFKQQAGPDGTPWKPLKSDLLANIPKKYRRKDGRLRATQKAFNYVIGRKILIKESHLLDSIVNTASDDYAEWGAGVIYAAIHQFGGKAGRGHKAEIPARPFLGISDEDEGNIVDLIVQNINAAIG